MTVESTLFDSIKGLVSNRVYPTIGPELATKPYITYQLVGGTSINFLDGDEPGKALPRFQVNVWGNTELQAKALIKQVETALRAVTALQTTVEGEPVATYEENTKLYGFRQDFSFIF